MTFSKNTLANIGIALVFILVATGIVFFQFNEIPNMMNKDEEAFAKLAMYLEGKPYTPYTPLATGHSTLYFYTILGSFYLFGFNEFGLRFPSAFFGVINITLFYFILRYVFKTKTKAAIIAGILGGLTLITLRWYINFARFAFEPTYLLFFELVSTLFIFKYRDSKKIMYLIVSGIFAGLAYNSYTPGRIFFILPVFTLLLDVKLKKFKWNMLRPVGIFLIPFTLIILPLTLYLSQHPDMRIYDQFFVTNEQFTILERITYLWQNVINNLGMLFFKGDINAIHNYPSKAALNPVIGIFFALGVILSIKNWKDFYNQFFFLYFVVGFIPTILTYPWENPNMLRSFTVLPSIVYFVAKSFLFLFQKIKYQIPVVALIVLLLLGSAFYELRTYFVFQADVFNDIFTSSLDFEYFREHDAQDL